MWRPIFKRPEQLSNTSIRPIGNRRPPKAPRINLMPASQAFHVLLTLLVSLFPLAAYLLVMAAINRRARPLLVRGSWDFAGLLGAVSGMLLWTVPALIMHLYQRAVATNPGDEAPRSFQDLWTHWWIVWACYYGLLVSGSILLLMLRSNVTAVYNVDVDQAPRLLLQTAQHLGFDAAQNDASQIVIATKTSEVTGTAEVCASMETASKVAQESRMSEVCAAVEIEPFPSLAHVSLHWYTSNERVRAEVEREFVKQAAAARPADNPAAFWFGAASTLLFGAIFMAIVMFSVATLFARRW
jgi:hypothetical protein